jgi:TP901-1 family phage major tail protein
MPVCSYQNPVTSKKIRSNKVKLLVYVGNYAYVAGQRDWNLSKATGTVDVSDKDSGGNAEFIYENTTTTASVSGIIVQGDITLQAFEDAVDNKCEVLIQREVTLPDGSVQAKFAWCLITNWTETASYNDVFQYSVDLQINGTFGVTPPGITTP